jgi:hypothetical protein
MVCLKKQWTAGALIENGVAAAQGTGCRENQKIGRLQVTLVNEVSPRSTRVHAQNCVAAQWRMGGGGRLVTGELMEQTTMAVAGALVWPKMDNEGAGDSYKGRGQGRARGCMCTWRARGVRRSLPG